LDRQFLTNEAEKAAMWVKRVRDVGLVPDIGQAGTDSVDDAGALFGLLEQQKSAV
jgi:hypothetical protein